MPRGQTGQQLLLGAYSALNRQIEHGYVTMYTRRDMLDVVLVDGKARGIIVRNLVTGEIERHAAHAVVLATGGYGNVYFLSTNAMGSNISPMWQAYKKRSLVCKSVLHSNSSNLYSGSWRFSIKTDLNE